ncbi:hypothetical protein OE699_09375 [Sedimentimonas flavescens]|uniref:Cadherin domain-containing protein n=1 Tax=Sedimentimonas flavescens TaxID=2851012 RepID=A0ABT2ZZ89_9RHOB|nr:hypothetical protein [Sedimentimonas flavescens]MCV2879065.1 hypothetical protein [Sedimentimonas flavescens]
MPKPTKGGGDAGSTTGGSTLRGTRGDDTLISTAGDDVVKGSSGTDTLVLDGSVWDYDWSRSIEKGIDWKLTDTSGGTGVDLLSGIEILQFNDATIVLGQDLPMEISGVPETFAVTEDTDASFSFTILDLDDNQVSAKLSAPNGNWTETTEFGRLTVLSNTDSYSNGDYKWGPQSTQRVYDFSFEYNEAGVSLAEGEVWIETVTLYVTTTSTEDFFGYTPQETRAVTFDLAITGVNDAPTIRGTASFVTDDTGEARFDLSALGSDIDSDDDGTTLDYEIVSVTQNYVHYRYPFDISTEGSTLVVSPEGLPIGLTTDEESWAKVELRAVDGHGAVSESTATVDVTLHGTATSSVRASVLGPDGEIDLSSVSFDPADVLDYGTATLFSAGYTDPALVAPMLDYTLGDDARHISAGTISGYTFETDETVESRLGLGADTLVFNLTSPTQQFFALNEIDTGWGEDVVILQMLGGEEMRFYGSSIDTGAQSDQVVIRADAQSGAWFNPEINTGSGHDVVDLHFTHLGASGELISDASIVLGSGDDSLSFVLDSDPSVALATKISLSISGGGGDDVIHVDTSDVTSLYIPPLEAPGSDPVQFYPGGTEGSIWLGSGDDTLSLALNAPVSGSTHLSVYGDDYSGNDGFDSVTLLNLSASDVTVSTTTDSYGAEGVSLSMGDGQFIDLYGIDEVIFSDGETWLL